MQFELSIMLDNAEIEDAGGVDMILPQYLRLVASRVWENRRDGKVQDGNGNTIGQWQVIDAP